MFLVSLMNKISKKFYKSF